MRKEQKKKMTTTTTTREIEKERAFKSTHEFCPRRTARRRRRACPGNHRLRRACRQILEGVLLRQPLFLFVYGERSDKKSRDKTSLRKNALTTRKNVKKVGAVPLL
jgi:hypothetical protein